MLDRCREGLFADLVQRFAAVRGGRFVADFSGEQYALPQAVGLLRETRRAPACDQWVSLSGADPLNLAGILTPGPRLAALTGNRLIYRDGVPVAVLSGGEVRFLVARNCRAMGGTEQAVAVSRAGIDGRLGVAAAVYLPLRVSHPIIVEAGQTRGMLLKIGPMPIGRSAC